MGAKYSENYNHEKKEDIISFDVQKARELINFLLFNDINIYKKLLPQINRLNSESIEMLFNGEINYNYNIKNKGILKKLLNKFENFQILLEQWYKDKKYYKYLKILWIKYPCIEDLKGRNMEEIEEIMKSYSIEFKSWPQKIKIDFKELINQTSDTRIFELKKEIKEKYRIIDIIFKKLTFIKNISKNWKEEGKYISYNSNKIIENISLSIKPFEICNSKKGYLCQNFCCPSEENNININLEISFKNYDDEQEKLISTDYDNKKLDNLKTNNKIETYIFKNKIESCIHAGLSFISLFDTIYKLRQTFMDSNLITKYKSIFDKVIEDFKLHQKLIGILPDNFEKANNHIFKILNLIKRDQKKLEDLIDISEKIKVQEWQNCKSIISILKTFGLAAIGLIESFKTNSVLYGLSFLTNVIALIIELKNFSESFKCLKQYKEYKNLLQS